MYHLQPCGNGFIFKNYLLRNKIGAKIIYNVMKLMILKALLILQIKNII